MQQHAHHSLLIQRTKYIRCSDPRRTLSVAEQRTCPRRNRAMQQTAHHSLVSARDELLLLTIPETGRIAFESDLVIET